MRLSLLKVVLSILTLSTLALPGAAQDSAYPALAVEVSDLLPPGQVADAVRWHGKRLAIVSDSGFRLSIQRFDGGGFVEEFSFLEDSGSEFSGLLGFRGFDFESDRLFITGENSSYFFRLHGPKWRLDTEFPRPGITGVLEGTTLLLNSPQYDFAGSFAVSAFTLRDRQWVKQARLRLPQGPAPCCDVLDLDGDQAAIAGPASGGSGQSAIHVFLKSGDTWTKEAELIPSLLTRSRSRFVPEGLRISENLLACTDDASNSTFVFERTTEGWVERQSPASTSSTRGLLGTRLLLSKTVFEPSESGFVPTATLESMGERHRLTSIELQPWGAIALDRDLDDPADQGRVVFYFVP